MPSSTSQSTLLRRPRSSWNCTTLSLLRERWVGCLTITLKEKIDLLFRRSQDLHFQKYQPSAQGSEAATSAMAALLQSVSNSGYQLVVTAPTPQPVKDQVVVNNSSLSTTVRSQCIRNVQGVVSMAGSLSGAVGEDSPPSILIVAHYDSAGAAPRSLMITTIVGLLCELNDNG